MFLFGLGGLVYVSVLLINAVAILSEDRFLARIGWTASTSDPGFGAPREDVSIKGKLITFINSVRTLMRIPLIAINAMVIIYLLILG